MTAGPSIDTARFLHDELSQASPDLMREMLATFINALLSAQADAMCGAEYGTRSPERDNRRNGYRYRDLDTRAGTIDIAIPKLREATTTTSFWLAMSAGLVALVSQSGRCRH